MKEISEKKGQTAGAGKSLFSEEEILELEQRFIDKYYRGDGKRPMITLLRLYKGQYHKLLLSAFFCLIKTMVSLVTPIATANIIDTLTRGGDFWASLWWNTALVVGTLALNIPFTYLCVRYRSLAARSVEAGLRGAVVKKLQQLTVKFDAAMSSGRIQSKIIRDVENVHVMFCQLFEVGLDVLINFSAILVILLWRQNWFVILFFCLCIPVTVLMSRLFLKPFRQKNHAFRTQLESTSNCVVDMVEMMPITRAHALENVEVDKMNGQVLTLADKGHKVDRFGALFGSVNYTSVTFFQTVCLVFCAILAFFKRITIGAVTLYTNYYARLISYVNLILNLIPIIASGSEAITSVGEILAAEDVEDNEGKAAIGTLRGRYDFENVRFGYEEDNLILNGLDLHVAAGETVALVGESGAGKTTVLNLVTGFYMPESGRLCIDGTDIRDLDLNSYRSHIAMVPQTSVMFSGTIRENIVYGLEREVSDAELAAVLEKACLTEAVAALPNGVNTVVGERGNALSGGQRQRVSIARAIIRDPSVIIFDEATSALDTVSEKKIQQAIANLTADRTTFIVAHRLSTIRDADKIAVIDKGRCIEYGTYDELMRKQGAFYKFRQLQT